MIRNWSIIPAISHLILFVLGRPNRGRLMVYDWRLWVLVGTAVIASNASECIPPSAITRLVVENNVVFAYSKNGYWEEPDGAFASYDAAVDRWVNVEEVPASVAEVVGETAVLPITACVPDNLARCFRIDGGETVLESADGGGSWSVGWQVPSGRRLFMERNFLTDTCKPRIDSQPYDLVISGSGEDFLVMVAFGNEGVVMRQADGTWERRWVLDAWPTPYTGSTLYVLMDKMILDMGIFGLFVFAIFSIQFSVFLRRKELLFVPLVVVSVVACGLNIILYGPFSGFIPTMAVLFFGLSLILWLIHQVVGNQWKIEEPSIFSVAVRVFWLSTITILVTGIFLMYLWMLGVLPFYWLMLGLVLGTAVGLTYWAFKKHLNLLESSRIETYDG